VFAAAGRHPILAVGFGAVATAAVGEVLAGPVAGTLAAGYAVLALRAWLRGAAERGAAAARAAAVDAVGALAADLRAGLPATAARTAARPALAPGLALAPGPLGSRAAGPSEPTVARAARLVDVAWQVADALGAPLADLLDRIDAELRTAERARADAVAQTAAARVTGWLLAALPGAGIALGYGIGGDPLHILLHTPLGAACALGAFGLQCAGLAWTTRICRAVSQLEAA
jgi:tight adherence protein B